MPCRRWWQLETWLRELVALELRAAHGVGWEDQLRRGSPRQAKDAAFTHMAGVDNLNPLAYMDYSQLLEIIADDWDRFAYALLTRPAWEGKQDELKQIRIA